MARALFGQVTNRSNASPSPDASDRSHAPRGNAAPDAPRPALREGDAERHRMHSHAERGNDRHILHDYLETADGEAF